MRLGTVGLATYQSLLLSSIHVSKNTPKVNLWQIIFTLFSIPTYMSLSLFHCKHCSKLMMHKSALQIGRPIFSRDLYAVFLLLKSSNVRRCDLCIRKIRYLDYWLKVFQTAMPGHYIFKHNSTFCGAHLNVKCSWNKNTKRVCSKLLDQSVWLRFHKYFAREHKEIIFHIK